MIDPVAHIVLATLIELTLLIATSRNAQRTEREAIAMFDRLLRRLLNSRST
jgi:hypothetical protein